MNELKLKKQILYFMLFSKIIIIAYIWIMKNTGGMSTEQAVGAITLITPLFAAYLGVMYKEFTQNKLQTEKDKVVKTISKSYRNLSYITLSIYVVIIVALVTMKSSGTFSYGQFQTMLTAVESGFGVYVGQIIFSLFKVTKAE